MTRKPPKGKSLAEANPIRQRLDTYIEMILTEKAENKKH